MKRALVTAGRWPRALARGLRRREPPGPARVDGRAGQGRARASSIRCRRSSPTSRSPTTRSTCPTRSSRARSSPPKGGSKLAPDLDAPPRAARSVSARVADDGRHARSKDKAMYALVRTPDKDVYQVRAGNYMGQNFGVDHRHHRHRDQAEGTRAGQRAATGPSGPARCSCQAGRTAQGRKTMSAYLATTRRTPRQPSAASRAGLAALAALAFAAAAWSQAPNSIDPVTVSKGASGRTIVQVHAEGRRPPIRPPASRSPARRASRSTSSTRPTRSARRSAQVDDAGAAQPQRHPGGQPHARRVQPEPAADLRDAASRATPCWSR